jgi:3-oxoacyl-[acyl-carrier protein] reductase
MESVEAEIVTNLSLPRKTAVITGASGGIGRATARLLAEAGGDLILHGHANRASLASLVAELKSQHPAVNTAAVYADLSQETEQEQLIQAVSAICPVPDILVLAAGCDLMNPAMKHLSFDKRLARLWQVDVVSVMRLSRFFGERMKATAGTIVFFGWDGVEYGMAGETAQLYAAAKGAVQGFSRSLAKSLAPEVRVNCVAPGWIKTTWGETASPATDERVAAASLARRWGTAEEIAEVVRFLVSDAAAYLNNQTIHLNGGRGDF